MAYFHNPPYTFYDSTSTYLESKDYGILNQNGDGIKLVSDGYSTLNFQGAGITKLYNGAIYMLHVPINKPFMVFTRASGVNQHSLLIGIKQNGSGYDVFTIGQCEVFIFTDDVESEVASSYGVNIYNAQGRKVMHSIDQSIKIVDTFVINRGQTWTWGGSGKRKFAYNYLGSGGNAVVNFGDKNINVARDLVLCAPNSFGIQRINWKGSIPIDGNGIVGTDIKSTAQNGYLTGLISNPIGYMTIIDVTDLQYYGMIGSTNY